MPKYQVDANGRPFTCPHCGNYQKSSESWVDAFCNRAKCRDVSDLLRGVALWLDGVAWQFPRARADIEKLSEGVRQGMPWRPPTDWSAPKRRRTSATPKGGDRG